MKNYLDKTVLVKTSVSPLTFCVVEVFEVKVEDEKLMLKGWIVSHDIDSEQEISFIEDRIYDFYDSDKLRSHDGLFSSKLRLWRKRLKLSVNELSNSLNICGHKISRSHIKMIESGDLSLLASYMALDLIEAMRKIDPSIKSRDWTSSFSKQR